jgi:hypothetical protein
MPALPAIDVGSPVTARRVGIGMSVLFWVFLGRGKKYENLAK